MVTTPTVRCDLTDLPVTDCAHCRGVVLDEDNEPVRIQRGTWFTALYPGRCSQCGTTFEPGDQIRADGLHRGGWLGECCGEDDDG